MTTATAHECDPISPLVAAIIQQQAADLAFTTNALIDGLTDRAETAEVELDITAYSNLLHVGRHEKVVDLNEGEPGGPDDWCYYDNHVQAFAYDCFPASFRGIPILGTKQAGSAKFLEGGCYEITDMTETHGFRAGSYSGYNHWRRDLARQFNPDAGPDAGADLPFYELIWFADNEGSIGPEAASDLLADFRAHADRYRPGEYEDYYRDKYADWTRAFELAATAGLVRFH